MSANRAKNSKPEVALRKALWHAGFRGYRLHYKKAPGRPDIAFVSRKIAIFLNGCGYKQEANSPIWTNFSTRVRSEL